MEIPGDISDKIRECVSSAKRILIISHRHPDADTVGSNMALRLVFERYGKDVHSACVDAPDSGSSFLPSAEKFLADFQPEQYDLFITVDAGSVSQVAFAEKYPELLKSKTPLINIDHHPSNNRYGKINLVIDHAASTTLVIFFLLKKWEEEVSAEIATCLLYGLYYDTGSFMHSNTSAEVLEAAAELLHMGARQDLIVKNIFKRHTIEQLRLWGKVLSDVEVTSNNVVVSAVKDEDIQGCDAAIHDLSGAIDYLSMVKENKMATLLSEDGKGNIRGSFRTRREDVDVSALAGNFGGGGHKKASGFQIKGKLKKETRWAIEPGENG